MVLYNHDISESSAFFQGFIDCYFTMNRFSFQIKTIFEDHNEIQEFNVEKFRPLVMSKLNHLISERKKEGYDSLIINDFKFSYPFFVNNSKEEGYSGRFSLYPKTAICKRCHYYLNLDKDEQCNCDQPPTLEQFTFIAFCDTCGAHYPIHAMSNVQNDCPSCTGKNTMKRLNWKRKDDLLSYSVQCVQCGLSQPLVLYKCDHTDRLFDGTKKLRSSNPPTKFRAVPARGGSIIHPFELSTPDIPQIDDIDREGKLDSKGRLLTEAFVAFFNDLGILDESRLFLPEFWELLSKEGDFWNNGRVKIILEDLHLSTTDITSWRNFDRWKILRTVLIDAKTHTVCKSQGGSNKDEMFSKYSLNSIAKCLIETQKIQFDQNDLQGLFLLTGDQPEGEIEENQATMKRDKPKIVPHNWNELLHRYGLSDIIQISDLNMVQIIMGVVEGSTRRDILLFKPIITGTRGQEKPTVFVRRFKTEGIVFKMDAKRILEWLFLNNFITEQPINDYRSEVTLRTLVQSNEIIKNKVDLLLHTFSHLLIQQSSIDTGLDAQSMSEIIYPGLASILIYSTSSIDTGGIEYTYDHHVSDWLSRIDELAHDCVQDPSCMEDEGGACNACLILPEFVCQNFNQNLDRSCLIGGRRYAVGYFRN